MSEPNALLCFRAPYIVSIIFGTMPIKLKLSLVDHRSLEPSPADTNLKVKFAITSIAWTALVSAFIISDIKTITVLSPTWFFSKKVIDNFPNDYYCIRLLGNTEISLLLVCSLLAARRLLYIADNFKSYRLQYPCRASTKSSKSLRRKIAYLLTFYSLITTLPIINDLLQLYRHHPEHLDARRITQEILHCIPISINMQFCSLCLILTGEFESLNNTIRESCSWFPENVRKLGQSHSAICQLVRQLSRTYRVQLFLETGVVTLNILLHTFHVLNANNHKLQSRYADITCSSLWTAHYAGRLFTTCMLASNTVTQAKETRRVLLQLEDFNQISNNHDQIISLVNRITNQDINFNICGFFVLDGNLIISVSERITPRKSCFRVIPSTSPRTRRIMKMHRRRFFSAILLYLSQRLRIARKMEEETIYLYFSKKRFTFFIFSLSIFWRVISVVLAILIGICSWCISFILILLQFRMPT